MKITKGGRIGSIGAFAVFLAGCGNTESPDLSPAFDNVSLSSPLYVAYISPDPLTKPDIIHVSFDYNASKVKSIIIQATLDSGKTWLAVSSVTPNGSNKASVAWVPRDDTLNFHYFGFKEGYVRISDTVSFTSITSTAFSVIGATPFVLRSPTGGETFHGADSIQILYSQNQDLTATVSVCAKTEDKADWALNIGETIQVSKQLPVKNYATMIVPDDLAADTAHINLSEPLIILLADYGTNGMRIQSGAIPIIP